MCIRDRYRTELEQGEITVFGVGRTLFNPIPGRIIDLDRKSAGLRGLLSKEGQLGSDKLRLTAGIDLEQQHDERREYQNDGIPGDLVGKVNNGRIFDLVSLGDLQLDQTEKVRSFGTFVELDWTLSPELNITAGGRYDRFNFNVTDQFIQDGTDDSGNRNMSAFSPQLGLAYRISPVTAFYGNFATAFQTPTTS